MSEEREEEQLQSDLASEREALLAVVLGVDEQALPWPTRNPDSTVRDVLAHVLASDANLIWLLEEASRSGTRSIRMPGLKGHQREMTRWAEATPQALAQELRERGNRWRELLAALPDSAFEIPVDAFWGGGVRRLLDVLGDWRGHYPLHTEDVRQALADRRADAAE